MKYVGIDQKHNIKRGLYVDAAIAESMHTLAKRAIIAFGIGWAFGFILDIGVI